MQNCQNCLKTIEIFAVMCYNIINNNAIVRTEVSQYDLGYRNEIS